MPQGSLPVQPTAIVQLRDASKKVVEGVNQTYPAFTNLSLDIFPGQKLGIFAVNGPESRALVGCLSGVEALDSGTLEQSCSVSWPLGTNEAFSSKLSGYVNARFAAEVYSSPGQVESDLRLIKELSGISDRIYHEPFGDWPNAQKDALKFAVSLAFDFDVIAVGRLKSWDHRSLHPKSVRIRDCFERRIAGRALLVSANGQTDLALDYCDEGLALVNGQLVYRGDPEVCLQLVKEESRRQKLERREMLSRRISEMVEKSGADPVEDEDEADGEPLAASRT
jgi:ABC-type polysaccharide/polyol phosphate transport system ATPase subunit